MKKAALAGFYGPQAQADAEGRPWSYPRGDDPRRDARDGPVFASPQGRVAWERMRRR